jgi:hypothetical protein
VLVSASRRNELLSYPTVDLHGFFSYIITRLRWTNEAAMAVSFLARERGGGIRGLMHRPISCSMPQ